MEQMYKIKESELKMFHMAAILQVGENNEAQEIVDEIRSRKISETVVAQNSTSNNISRDVILAAGHKWYDGTSCNGSVEGFIAGAEWALKQTPVE